MKEDTFYLVPSYRGRKDMYLVRRKEGKYELWQNSFGGQEHLYLGDATDILIALAQKANLPQ